MTWGLTANGLETETQAEVKERIKSLFQGAYGNQVEIDDSSVFGELINILAELIAAAEQEVLETYRSYDRDTAIGVALDRLGKLINIPRKGATRSSSEGTITGTPATAIADLSRVRLNATNTVWEITGGPYVIPGGGTIPNVPLQSQDTGPITALTAGPSEWTIVDVVAGWTSWETTEDATPGINQEVDKDYRTSQDTGLSIRGQGPLLALAANIQEVDGVVRARAFHNPSVSPVDSDGIPFKAMNPVVGTDPAVPTTAIKQAVALAIWNTIAGGGESFGTDVTETITDEEGQAQQISYDLETQVNVWIDVDITTSDEDESITPNIETTLEEFIATEADAQFANIGDNVQEYKINGLVFESGVTGVTSVVVRLSIVGFAGPFLSPEIPISIREVADFDLTRVQVTVV